MRIANDVQKAGRPHTSHVGDVIDEAPSDAVLPEVRLDEQGVQLRATIGTGTTAAKPATTPSRSATKTPPPAICSAGSAIASGFARSASRSPGLASDARHCSASSIL